MAKERIEDVSTVVLLKRKKFFIFIAGIFVGVMLVWIALIIYGFIKEGASMKSINYGGLASLAGIWLPLIMIKRINTELQQREENRRQKSTKHLGEAI